MNYSTWHSRCQAHPCVKYLACCLIATPTAQTLQLCSLVYLFYRWERPFFCKTSRTKKKKKMKTKARNICARTLRTDTVCTLHSCVLCLTMGTFLFILHWETLNCVEKEAIGLMRTALCMNYLNTNVLPCYYKGLGSWHQFTAGNKKIMPSFVCLFVLLANKASPPTKFPIAKHLGKRNCWRISIFPIFSINHGTMHVRQLSAQK